MAVSRGQCVRHHTGGGHTAISHAIPTASPASAARPSVLGLPLPMSTELSALQQRLQAVLGDAFTVGAPLGQGGFAVVYRVRDNRLGRDVAVKVLDPVLSPSPALAERFVREAQTIARLEHPNIVPIYEVGKDAGLLYITMRCIDGPSLAQLLAARRRLSPHDAARIARQVADALAYAHAQGVVHRDIKPDNVLLDRQGHVLVTDFGIAKAAQSAAGIGQLTAEGMIIGSPAYMSPEQAAGEPVDGRADIYSLGIVLYQMLAGETPFAGGSAAALLAKQLTAVPAPIRRARADVSPEVAFVLERMLAKAPAERFQHASEVSAALIAALPAAATGRLRVPLRRRLPVVMVKSLVGLGLAGCLAAVAFVAGALVVSFVLFSTAPRLSVSAPVPDSLAGALRDAGALDLGEAIEFAFVPGAREDSTLLVISGARITVAAPDGIRRYGRDSSSLDGQVQLRGGVRFLCVVVLPGGRRDTVFHQLSFREYVALAPALAAVSEGEAVRVRVRPVAQRSRLREATP